MGAGLPLLGFSSRDDTVIYRPVVAIAFAGTMRGFGIWRRRYASRHAVDAYQRFGFL